MPSIIVNSRARLKVEFKKDRVLFDPQVVLFASTFTPATFGVPETQLAYEFGVNAEIVQEAVGIYYVEQLFETTGMVKFTWRSTAWGEERVVEEICKVNARTVVE
jgi:hypothetical protein